MRVRLFGSNTCERCELIRNGLTLMGYKFEFVDAMSPDNDEICDLHNVDMLPHIQIIDDNDNIVWQKADKFSLTVVVSQLNQFGL
jgi:arsenate reductase-like glutaredoxin family protein